MNRRIDGSTDRRIVNRRHGFTLWELTMVLLVMSVAATLSAPAFARLVDQKPPEGADAFIALLRDARTLANNRNATVTLRIDPISMKYQVDTAGVFGSGTLTTGRLDMGLSQTLVSDAPRLRYVFQPAGAAFADTVIVRGGARPLVIRVDPWSGVAHADTV
jgi:prepilin-type N-terminal cleavage/methylation domain-containing protein